jgi:GxxExxY protein
MAIDCELAIQSVTNDVFNETDLLVMRCAYAAHNQLGRLCDEIVYENDVVARLRALGVRDVSSQVPLNLSVGGFSTTLRLDLVVNNVLYEAKAAEMLAPIHEAQATSYAALLALNRVKLLNFGSDSVQGKLLGCPFADIDRFAVSVDRTRWKPIGSRCESIADLAEASLREWGGFLEACLYEKPLVWSCGGKERCEYRLPVSRHGMQLGTQRVFMHARDCAFVVTGVGDRLHQQESHLRRLLKTLPIRAWQWINVFHQQMQLITLIK